MLTQFGAAACVLTSLKSWKWFEASDSWNPEVRESQTVILTIQKAFSSSSWLQTPDCDDNTSKEAKNTYLPDTRPYNICKQPGMVSLLSLLIGVPVTYRQASFAPFRNDLVHRNWGWIYSTGVCAPQTQLPGPLENKQKMGWRSVVLWTHLRLVGLQTSLCVSKAGFALPLICVDEGLCFFLQMYWQFCSVTLLSIVLLDLTRYLRAMGKRCTPILGHYI